MSAIPILRLFRDASKLPDLPADEQRVIGALLSLAARQIGALLSLAARQIRDGRVDIDAVLPSIELQDAFDRLCQSGTIDDSEEKP